MKIGEADYTLSILGRVQVCLQH